MKTNCKIYIALAVLLAVAAIIMYWKEKKKQKDKAAEEGENEKNREIKYMDDLLLEKLKNKNEFPLRIGSEGKSVEQLQRYLKDKVGAKVSTNGILDDKTLSNVKGFLKMDEVSEDTFKKLRMSDFKTFGNYPA